MLTKEQFTIGSMRLRSIFGEDFTTVEYEGKKIYALIPTKSESARRLAAYFVDSLVNPTQAHSPTPDR